MLALIAASAEEEIDGLNESLSFILLKLVLLIVLNLYAANAQISELQGQLDDILAINIDVYYSN